jgi:hypothetical protein
MRIRDVNFGYLFKHWIFSLVIGPFVSQIIAFIPVFYPSQAVGLLGMFPIVFILSFIFSIPTYIIYALIYYYFANKHFPILYSKAILISISIIGVFITTNLIDGSLWYFIACSYSISSIIAGLVFNLDFKHEEK